ncbi:hypothetical protein AWL63_06275 [Sphingomonas panacis]|uniref:Uncharacterized protein n=1 Tax=Sphingomonas panacis TaxID=1560345 RepID=A0A1B3Z875_9SPHN|nr:hypothetical protein [Sphingomonas panacis]AOH83638.1 hypothetical protein AWL63_06275 [Sphingomonas panacis]
MTKPVAPLTFPHAIRRVAAVLDYPEIARVVRRSPSLARKWSDPATGKSPSLNQALAIEAAYRAAGGEGSPILEAFGFQLDAMIVEQSACQRALADEIAHFAKECGEAIAVSIAITQPGSISPSSVHHALVEAEQARSAAGTFIGRLKSFLPRGAGPLGENAGGGTE